MPVVEYYFQTQNHFFPLFHQASFMRLITKWYSPKSDQDRCTWAAILVVIALGLQHMSASSISDFGEAKRRSWINYCMKNSQSVLFELMAREEDLLGLQVILSLCMLFRDALVKKPAAMLLGMAMRLINALHLHSKDFAKHLSEEEVRQRSNVFWMANILDKVCNTENGQYAKRKTNMRFAIRVLAVRFVRLQLSSIPTSPLPHPLKTSRIMLVWFSQNRGTRSSAFFAIRSNLLPSL